MTLEDAINNLATQLGRLATVAERFVFDGAPPMPGACQLLITGEDTDMDLIKFKIQVPAEATADVVRRDVTVKLPTGDEVTATVEGREAGETQEFAAPQDSAIVVSVVNVDDAGNVSAPRVQLFEVKDTIAPPAPGELGLVVTGEETE